ncbi:MAG: molybdopterin-guanine dinucleotide biosynthesis protein B [Methanoculleaceae archaeon]
MKVIQVVGPSNEGKTTFITSLIRDLSRKGRVAAVKHSPEHLIAIEPGKDTTRMYEAGADSAGIDREKSMILLREHDLPEILDLFCDAGVEYAIVEGFRSYQNPRIVLGDMEDPLAILRNPGVAEVIENLHRFPEYYSTAGLVRSLVREVDMERAGAILTFQGVVRRKTGDARTEHLDVGEGIGESLRPLQNEIASVPGILGVKMAHRTGRLYPGEGITYIAVIAEHRHEGFRAIQDIVERIKDEHHSGAVNDVKEECPD